LVVAVFGLAAYLSRVGITLHRRGVESSTIAILIAIVAGLDIIVGVVVVVFLRRWKRSRAESPVKSAEPAQSRLAQPSL
jgi:ABC-type amino acid transport system permease subunit